MNYDHLLAISDSTGVFEHCLNAAPRVEYGYCVDDVSRALIFLTRAAQSGEPQSDEVRALSDICLDFVVDSQSPEGLFINRRAVDGSWFGPATAEDHWGRALWSLGIVAGSDSDRRGEALRSFDAGAVHRPVFLRSMVFAGLGAAAIVESIPDHDAARLLLSDAALRIDRGPSLNWPWPEARLTYANAALPEVLIRAGHLLDSEEFLVHGLELLRWLLIWEMLDHHYSVSPAGGWSLSDPRPGFDQQPIEVAALVDACAAAYEATGDPAWIEGIRRGAAWFDGDNDTGIVMGNASIGSGFDGLREHGRNGNQGAESTLAYLMVMHRHQVFAEANVR
jgi:hypothetical protein